MDETILSLRNLNKDFGSTKVLQNLSIDINKGEFITLLGPSGCGKTTTLRIIAGLEALDSGSVILNGAEISNLEPNKRSVNTVFQNYALFPHMNVFDNIGYGLRIRNVPKAQIRQRVTQILELVEMEGFESRMSSQLSGGQRQRVAIARALINKPDILLLDEPLGALDLKLRRRMQTELKRIQARAGITFVYVTHDQEEALNMSDHIAVISAGRLEQLGTPEEIYLKPKTKFVAEFVGDRNILTGKLSEVKGQEGQFDYGGGKVKCRGDGLALGENIALAIHSDRMMASLQPTEGFDITARVTEINYTGSQSVLTVVHTKTKDEFRVVQYREKTNFHIGSDVYIGWNMEDGVVIREEQAL